MLFAMHEEDSGGLMPIGRFARLCRLSVKQLRNYDELGLLPPAHVDPDSGYRYYRPGQARTALSIGLLRSLDVPLTAIAEVLSGASPAEALARVRENLEAELARRRRALATLEHVLTDGLPKTQVSVVREPARRVVAVRDVAAGPEDVARATSGCAARLLAHGMVPLAGLFPLELGEQIPVTVTALAEGTQGPPPGTRPDVLPGGVFARAVHIGPYDQIGLTAHALLAWCAERGHQPPGPIREVYLSDPAVTPPEQLITHLLVRLEDG